MEIASPASPDRWCSERACGNEDARRAQPERIISRGPMALQELVAGTSTGTSDPFCGLKCGMDCTI